VTATLYRLTRSRDRYSYFLLTLALTVFAVAPLTYPGYIQVHSGFVPLYNLADLAHRPPSLGWTPTVATQFDPLRGDGLLPYYLALPLVWPGGAPLMGVKAIFALSFVLGAAGVYLWLQRSLGAAGAALAALVYTYLPYHIAVVYVRGAWGEALFLGLLPWALAALRLTGRQLIPGTALIWACLGLSQAGLAVWAFLLSLAWLAVPGGLRWGFSGNDQEDVRDNPGPYGPLLAALIGMLIALAWTFLAAGFSLPPSPVRFFDHFLYPAQLFSAYWGFGASRPGWDDGLALGFGFAAVGLTLLTLFLTVRLPRTPRTDQTPSAADTSTLTLALTSTSILSLLLFAPFAFLWRWTGLHHTLTYPWQLLGFIGLCLSVLAGASVRVERRLAALPAYAGLVTLVLLASYPTLEPRFTQFAPGTGPLAAWDSNRLMLLDYQLSVEIPPAAAGLSESTPRRLPLADYGSPRPGDTLHLTLTWQATRPFYRDWKLFVHLLDSSGQMVTQADPLAGAGAEKETYFTSRWDPGELIRDDVTLAIPPDASPGPYHLALGLYDGETLERLPVVGREGGEVRLKIGSSR